MFTSVRQLCNKGAVSIYSMAECSFLPIVQVRLSDPFCALLFYSNFTIVLSLGNCASFISDKRNQCPEICVIILMTLSITSLKIRWYSHICTWTENGIILVCQ